MALSSFSLLSTWGCGALIGLDSFESDDAGTDSDSDSDSDGSGGTATGGGSGSGGSSGCSDDEDPGSIDEGCTTATPACDDASKTCFECVEALDCGPAAVCGAPTCEDHRCAAPVGGGVQTVELMNSTTLNGSFEDTVPTAKPKAVGWTEEFYSDAASDYVDSQITLDCTAFNCISTTLLAYDGDRLAWLGPFTDPEDPAEEDPGVADYHDHLISPAFTLPAGTTSLRVISATYIFTWETDAAVFDTSTVLLVRSDGEDIVVGARSNLDASETEAWEEFGFDETIEIPAGWENAEVKLVFESENDSTSITAFAYDNLRLVATVDCE